MTIKFDYEKSLIGQFWEYAEIAWPRNKNVLDSYLRDPRRAPVFKVEYAFENVLFPPDTADDTRAMIVATLPTMERHRWFRSMKSSQALAQSVFGNLIVAGNLGLLEGLESDEGLPAFCNGLDAAHAQLEYSVKHLGEPRPTSVDVWINGSRRIAVECKLTEADFGTCSRTRLIDGKDSNYTADHCDGSYTHQRGRKTRCSLTEVGVRYWDHVPGLLNWSSDEDHVPCPLRGTYQLIRNVLAACVTPGGRIDSNYAHALIIYDARNPSFQAGGVANTQWAAARAALKDAGMLRSVSWQGVVEHLAQGQGVPWLVEQLKKKYGF